MSVIDGCQINGSNPESYVLPSSVPKWTQGQGFAKGIINLGELDVAVVKDFIFIATYTPLKAKLGHGVTFYKPPPRLPSGWFTFGHYAKLSGDQQPNAYILAARDNTQDSKSPPPLELPLSYTLIWTSGTIFVWKPNPPLGYRALGFVVTTDPFYSDGISPDRQLVRCVRDDLTEFCQLDDDILLGTTSTLQVFNFKDLTTGKSVNVRTAFCTSNQYPLDQSNTSTFCLKNLNPNHLEAMPNLEQVGELIHHYGPTVYFHPDEVYLPSSVPWFFNNKNSSTSVKNGNLDTAHPYIHVKPALGATFTDIDMWIFYPTKGPVTFTFAKLFKFKFNIKQQQHDLGYWEHFTLRLSNFDGQLYSLYFSNHTGGKWVHASGLQFIEGNKPTVYSSKCGHATFPKPGTYIQSWSKLLGIGAKNDVDKSNQFIDASKKYYIIAAEYLGSVVAEPDWLQHMLEFH